MLGFWLAFVGVLAASGGGVADHLHSSSVLVPGIAAAHAADVQESRFGERNAVVVLLQAPAGRIDDEGRALTRRLQAVDHVTVAGP